jgi:hypothetical protein
MGLFDWVANKATNAVDFVGDAISGVASKGTQIAMSAAPYIPIVKNVVEDQEIDQALAVQKRAADTAGNYMQQSFNQIKDLNAPLIAMGTEQLAALKQGVESGAFGTNDAMFQSYQQYVAPEYEPGGQFQNEPRTNLVTPEKYQATAQRTTMQAPTASSLAGMTQPQLQQTAGVQSYGQQPSGVNLAQLSTAAGQRPTLPQAQQYQNSQMAPSVPQVGQYQSNQQAPTMQAPQQFNTGSAPKLQFNNQQAPAIQGGQQYQIGNAPVLQQFNGQRSALPQQQQFTPQQYSGANVQTSTQGYNGQAAPQQQQVNSQFNTGNYQAAGTAPQQYTAGAAPGASYYDPTAAANQFKVENDPGYQRRYAEAMKSVEASAAAQGMQLSGATLKELQTRAAGIASEETAAAYDRFSQDQSRIQGAQQYQTEDQYKRYLDQVGIKGAEADKAIAQFNSERSFGAEQNKESWLREQATKELGMNLNEQQYNQWLSSDGQKYQQYADQRDWTTVQSNQAAAADWEKYRYNTDLGYRTTQDTNAFNMANADRADARYDTGFNQNLQQNQQRQDAYAQNQGLGLQANAQNVQNQQFLTAAQQEQFNNQRNYGMQQNEQLQNAYAQNTQLGMAAQNNYQTNLQNYNQQQQNNYQYANDYGLQQNQANVQNQLTQYGLSRDAYTDDRAFNYGTQQDLYNNQLANASLQNQYYMQDLTRQDANIQQNNANQMSLYGMGLDQYNQNRNYAQTAQQQAFNQNLATYGAQQGAYQSNIDNMLNVNNQNFNQNLAYQNLQDQNYNFDQTFNANQAQQNYANTLDAYNINNANYNTDRAFNYGMQQDQQAQNFAQYQYNNTLRGTESANQYGLLTDQYNRALTQNTNNYGMMSDLTGYGLSGINNVSGATSDYYGSMADLALQKANAAAAASAAKSANGGLLSFL